jgi:glycosyltransferase involved in cell wall biosynthesis
MAAGKPLVATDIAGLREAVVHETTGLLVPPGNPPALAAALQRLIADPKLRARMGAAARERAEQNFADSIICAQTLLVYDSLIPRSRL